MDIYSRKEVKRESTETNLKQENGFKTGLPKIGSFSTALRFNVTSILLFGAGMKARQLANGSKFVGRSDSRPLDQLRRAQI